MVLSSRHSQRRFLALTYLLLQAAKSAEHCNSCQHNCHRTALPALAAGLQEIYDLVYGRHSEPSDCAVEPLR